MILSSFGQILRTNLLAHKCTIPLIYDTPERTQSINFARERIVLEYDTDETDSFGPPQTQSRNPPKPVATRTIALKATIYARHPNQGALAFEHKERAESILDMFVCALMEAQSSQQRVRVFPKSGRWLTPPDAKQSERPSGAMYELKFTIDRGIASTNWDGTSATEKTIGTDITIAETETASIAGAGSEQYKP